MSTALPPARPRLLAALYYLTYFAASGTVYPYFNVYYQSVGMTNQQIGVLAALPTVMTLFATPFWSGLADRFSLHHILLPGMLLATVVPALLLSGATTFPALAALVLFFMFLFSSAVPLAENTIVTMLNRDRNVYGSVRLWGAVGFGIASLATGYAAAVWGFSVNFLICAALVVLAAAVASRLPAAASIPTEAYFSRLRQLAANGHWRSFMVAVLLVSVGYAIFDNFSAIYLRDLGAAPDLLGLAFLLATLSEIPIFFYSPALIRRLTLRGVILMALLAFAVRGLAWSLVTTPEWGLAVQLLHGLSFSALWTAGVLYVSQIAPEGLGASAQSLFSVALMGLGRAVGALLGAALYDGLGAAPAFRWAALIALAGAGVFFLTQRRADRRAGVQTGEAASS